MNHFCHYDLKIHLTGLSMVYKKVLSMVFLNPGEKLLDIGCGTGTVLKSLALKYGNLVTFYGIDPDPKMLSLAREKMAGTNISLKIAFASDLPFTDNSLDWVISSLAFHHMDSTEKRKAVSEINRVLKRGGHALISDLGNPVTIVGKLFSYISASHAHTRGNMELIEASLNEFALKVVSRQTSLFWIGHILIEKPDQSTIR